MPWWVFCFLFMVFDFVGTGRVFRHTHQQVVKEYVVLQSKIHPLKKICLKINNVLGWGGVQGQVKGSG